ncbi:MAG: DNA gyrase subunit A [Rickettsiales bacterium]|nr:DNA gyrase subunit A [Pseudomonadota bacterium]MDA0965367.1 DNA gyrase subunit A [Pseudomonadota bacterium]MDG4544295.1 DNA gyrase subunit A [Rickettsiales bacterium]MDG4544860.1 DNA gyrase subunit A [Rickettsiales bacterium]MDG4546982.1 DNA gyrase subunit A [Rickettsiales bacterium]
MSQNNVRESLEIKPVTIEHEMRESYLDYAMSVIVSRAIPDACDGLKPVHRRILFAMNESGCDYNKPYRKSARIVGEVMGKYHPHGDAAIYQSMVRMAQDFSLRVPLIDGQGNFGSMDGDSAAAMRYTESRMAKVAHTLLVDIDKDTVNFQDNYDGSEREPITLPARFPNLLVNGGGGIAVGMATNIPPHNLGEVIDGCLAYIDNNDITDEELMQIIPGPDFPTGGIILGRSGSRNALRTGRGSIIVRGRAEITDLTKGKQAIIISEVPYQVNKALMLERIGELVRDKKIEGISEMRDESDQHGVRVVIETKKDANADVILNQLYSYTQLQTSFGVNQLALDRGRPRLMNTKEVLVAFTRFREEIITRRTSFLLNKARDRAHVLIGLSMAVANIDEVIRLIRNAPDPTVAKQQLLERAWYADNVQALIDLVDDFNNKIIDGKCYFTEVQARAILDMKLARLTGLEQEKINGELTELAEQIKDYLDILRSRDRVIGIMKSELSEIKEEFATPRKTDFQDSEFEADIEDLIPVEDMVVTVTHGGYIKRVPLSTYRSQKRGGKGRSGMNMKEEDATVNVFVTNTHTPVLFFSTTGKVYKLKVYKLPLGGANSKGRALVNIFPMEKDETINVVMPMPDNEDDWDNLSIMFATNRGTVRRNDLSDFKRVQANGKIAMKLEDDDRLISVKTCDENQHVLLATANGKCIRFPATAVREFKSRASAGVRGIRMEKGNEVVSMDILDGTECNDINIRSEYLKIPAQTRSELSALIVEKEYYRDDEAKLAEINDTMLKILDGIESELDHDTIKLWAKHEQFIITVTENGYGKRSSAYEYRVTNRGGSGIVNIITSQRNGKVAASFHIEDNDQLLLITEGGQLIRCPVHDIRIAGRNTQGVTIFKTSKGQKVTSVARIAIEEEKEDVESILIEESDSNDELEIQDNNED